MIDDGLKFIFTILKVLLRNVLKGEIWALVILGLIILVIIVFGFFSFLQEGFKFKRVKYHPYEEID